MKSLIIHCGFDKCGSTAIQSTLSRRRGYLLDRGVLYPMTGYDDRTQHQKFLTNAVLGYNPSPQPSDTPWAPFLDPPLHDFDTLAALLRKEVELTRPHTVVLSSEAISAPFYEHDEISRLVGIFDGPLLTSPETTAILVYRPAIDYVQSRWSHKIRNSPNFCLSPSEWLSALKINNQLDFSERLKALARIFDKVICIPYRASGLIEQFWAQVDLPTEALDQPLDQKANVTPSKRYHDAVFRVKKLGIKQKLVRSALLRLYMGLDWARTPFGEQLSSEAVEYMQGIDADFAMTIRELRNCENGSF